MGELEMLGEDLSPEAAELAGELRVLHTALGISVRRYASRFHFDAGTVSRFLSGKRVPPWSFVMGLLTELAEHRGEPATPATIAHLRLLHRKAITTGEATGRVQELQHLLEETDEQVREYQARERATAELLHDRQHRLQQVRLQMRAVESARAADREGHEAVLAEQQRAQERLRAERDQLQRQVKRLSEQLTEAQRATALTEERCTQLERQLDAAEEAERREEREQAGGEHHALKPQQPNDEGPPSGREPEGTAPDTHRPDSEGIRLSGAAELERPASGGRQSSRQETPQATPRSSSVPKSGTSGETPGQQPPAGRRNAPRLQWKSVTVTVLVVAAAVAVSGVMILGNHRLQLSADVTDGIRYHAGDEPSESHETCSGAEIQGCTGEDGWYWTLSAAQKSLAILKADNANSRLLSGNLQLTSKATDCAKARLKWEITTNDPAATPIATGTLRSDSKERPLTESIPGLTDGVVLTVERIDRESCDANLEWINPGLKKSAVS